ncbi:MAG: nucleotide sugar dehydrogenase [Verrucomicrobia bacterium]|nr:nucleotide sugar dehydrogenase [Verrucomicrobiota bacterium]
MNLSVFGLGYVGAVTAGCLARRGHRVLGVDVAPQKVELIARGESPIVEPGLGEMIRAGHASGQLTATTSCEDAVRNSEISIICVGTPSTPAGALDLSYVRHVAGEIAEAIARKQRPHTVVFRSTMLPGSTAALVREFFSAETVAPFARILYFPEFMREGTAVEDFEHPSLAVLGTARGETPPESLAQSLAGERVEVVSWNTAEMVKYACNAFHAAKIAFANEMGRLGKQLEVDARKVMALLCQDTRLNISPYYLRPGNPFGGSCLPKDVRAVSHLARQVGLHLPMVESLLPSNERHLQNLLGQIVERAGPEIVILGLSFKSQTDDLRESSMVEVAQYFLGRGHRVRIYDPALNLASLVGSNKRLIDARMPHLASLLKPTLAEALGSQGLVVVSQRCATLDELKNACTEGHSFLDVNSWPELASVGRPVHGFCW